MHLTVAGGLEWDLLLVNHEFFLAGIRLLRQCLLNCFFHFSVENGRYNVMFEGNPYMATEKMTRRTKVTCYQLDRQLKCLEADFLKEGGLRERMTRVRLIARSNQNSH